MRTENAIFAESEISKLSGRNSAIFLDEHFESNIRTIQIALLKMICVSYQMEGLKGFHVDLHSFSQLNRENKPLSCYRTHVKLSNILFSNGQFSKLKILSNLRVKYIVQ